MRVEFGPGRSWMIAPEWILRSFALAMPLIATPSVIAAAAEGGAASHAGPSEVVFLYQIILLLVSRRLLGEAMLRIGQPAVHRVRPPRSAREWAS